MEKLYRLDTDAHSRSENVVQGDRYRFTILTPCMIRLEYNKENIFIDQPSQTVWNRFFDSVPFQYNDNGESLRIETERLVLYYRKQEFSEEALRIEVKNAWMNHVDTWYYGERISTLKGTVRTLDTVDGAADLEEGLLSRNGYSVFDDSNSYLIRDDGELIPRIGQGIDMYFLGYGHEYKVCLKDYFRLTGAPPLLPRYALGNWWSRFYRYSEEEYQGLIHRFFDKKIPLSVAVIDMDWHITEVEPEYGSGWTGYSWNRSLFPDPLRFLRWLHENNLKVALNVHPADGVRAYEEAYPQMAKDLGVDPLTKQTIEFDCTNAKFLEAYFTHLHHPNERQGVDFWWIDWQQGESSKLPGLDPLWSLNHYHYLDNGKHNNRPLILSRYAGLGSHRYPIGFSGDTIISWKSLKFQPYFTATASNIGYGWWSHDIGGHMQGTHDEELQIRWIQFGVFTPILRLHCSSGIFYHKEPWSYSSETERIMTKYLRFRHRLIPYLYTMNYRMHQSGIPLMKPMYYEHQESTEAYEVPNEYYWGSEMICLPITEPVNSITQTAKVEAWIPEGIYIDWMTGLIYKGNKRMNLYRNLELMPVLLKAGAIIPCAVLTESVNDIDNPKEMELTICAGAVGDFILYEDEGSSMNYQDGKVAKTRFVLNYDYSEFKIHKVIGDSDLFLEERSYHMHFLGFADPKEIVVYKNNEIILANYSYVSSRNEIVLEGIALKPEEELIIRFTAGMKLASNNRLDRCFERLDCAKIAFEKKERIYHMIKNGFIESIQKQLQTEGPDVDLYGEIREIMFAI